MKGMIQIMKNRNWFWGIFFLLSGAFVVLSQLGLFGTIGFVSILATVFFAAVIIQSLVRQVWIGVFVPLAFLYMIYSVPLKLMIINPWLLIASALLISIGFSLIFKKKWHKAWCNQSWEKHDWDNHPHINEKIDDNNPYAKVSMSSSSVYLHADNLQSGRFYCNLGTLEVYFDEVKLSDSNVELFLDCNLGSIKLYIPRDWSVTENLNLNLADVKNKTRYAPSSEGTPRIKLTGSVTLGDVQIYYI